LTAVPARISWLCRLGRRIACIRWVGRLGRLGGRITRSVRVCRLGRLGGRITRSVRVGGLGGRITRSVRVCRLGGLGGRITRSVRVGGLGGLGGRITRSGRVCRISGFGRIRRFGRIRWRFVRLRVRRFNDRFIDLRGRLRRDDNDGIGGPLVVREFREALGSWRQARRIGGRLAIPITVVAEARVWAVAVVALRVEQGGNGYHH
jgi:hypothetical protein